MRKILLLFIVGLAACSGTSSEGPGLTFADFNNPPTTPEVLSGSSTTAPTVPPTTTTSTTTTTLLVVDTPVPVGILTATGYAVLEGPGAPRTLVEIPVAAGFDDLEGGFVFQLPGAGVDPAADQRIFWSRASSPDAQPKLDISDGSLLKVWATELIGDTPKWILTIVDEPDDPIGRVDRLVVFDVANGDRVLGEVGGADAGPRSISYGGGRFLLEQQSGVQTFFEFRNDQGAVIDLASNPQPGCTSDDRSCPHHPVLSPDGSFVAFVHTDADRTDLVLYDLDLGEETGRIPLPETLGEVESLDFDGTTVMVNRQAPEGALRALVVDTVDETVGEFGVEGIVRFLREGPAFEGTIAFPTQ
ncbi:MAG: hypothetical protein HKN80_09275 [Acidimicrobiia bacterium]|nr:hypothetical protein [Acidimicrobiia bacterium]